MVDEYKSQSILSRIHVPHVEGRVDSREHSRLRWQKLQLRLLWKLELDEFAGFKGGNDGAAGFALVHL